ncbi:MAG: M48 family metallopeptidase, partial [Pseudomonadota bacterium]
ESAPFDYSITPPLGNTPRMIRFKNGATCETRDFAAIAALEQYCGTNQGMRLVHFIESKWKMALGCFMTLIVAVWFLAANGIPYAAELIAKKIPPGILDKASKEALEFLDKKYVGNSKLDPTASKRIQGLFQCLCNNRLSDGLNYRLVFRKGNILGPNAFALPSGLIVMTDELVEIAKNDQEIIGVLAHEMAHIYNRHGLRSILQDASALLLISMLAGDITSTVATLPTMLVESGYSRRFEREADQAAGLYLIEKGWGVKPYQDILTRITKNQPDVAERLSLISSHPPTNERIELLNALVASEQK